MLRVPPCLPTLSFFCPHLSVKGASYFWETFHQERFILLVAAFFFFFLATLEADIMSMGSVGESQQVPDTCWCSDLCCHVNS